MRAQNTQVKRESDPVSAGVGQVSVALIQVGRPAWTIWITSWLVILFMGVPSVGGVSSWGIWWGAAAFTLASFACAFAGRFLPKSRPNWNYSAVVTAWLFVAAAYGTVFLSSNSPLPALGASVLAMVGWYFTIVSSRRSAKEEQERTPAADSEPVASPASTATRAIDVGTSHVSSIGDLSPLMSTWIDELLRISVRVSTLGSSKNQPSASQCGPSVGGLAHRMREIIGRLQRLVALSQKTRGEVRVPQVMEIVVDILAEQAKQQQVQLTRRVPGSVSPVLGVAPKILAGFYHLIRATIEACSVKSSGLVGLSISESGGLVWLDVVASHDPSRHGEYERAIRVLENAGAEVITQHMASGWSAKIGLTVAGPRSRDDLRPTSLLPSFCEDPNSAGTSRTAILPRPVRILYVDDEPAMRELVSEMLGLRNATVDTAETLGAVEHLVATHKYDAAILDVHMPDASGPEMYQRIIELVPGLAGRAIFCTGADLGDHLKRFLDDHNCPLVTKPFDSSALARAVRMVLTNQQNQETKVSNGAWDPRLKGLFPAEAVLGKGQITSKSTRVAWPGLSSRKGPV